MENNIGSILTRRAELNASREAYVDSQSGLRLTFKELNDRTNQVANMLLDLGVKKGDRFGLQHRL